MTHAKSLTHVHLLNCIKTTLRKEQLAAKVRILDAGCGDGHLIEYLHAELHTVFPNTGFEVFGFDVLDHGVQKGGFIDQAESRLSQVFPKINWASRIFRFRVEETWSFDPDFFDFVISNQVLEHIKDKPAFFTNVHRCLKTGGFSFHLAPLLHCVNEGHIWIPFAHRVWSYNLLLSYIKCFSRLGVGKYPMHRRETGVSLDEYARRHADYMLFWTSYSTQNETLAAVRGAGLRGDFRFTSEFYELKLRQILRMALPTQYRCHQSALKNAIFVLLLRYVSSVTLTIQKGNEY